MPSCLVLLPSTEKAPSHFEKVFKHSLLETVTSFMLFEFENSKDQVSNFLSMSGI